MSVPESQTILANIMIRVLLIDNYDSFTHNLAQAFASQPGEPVVKVVRNDAIDIEQARAFHPSHLVISPGPGRPEQAGISNELIRSWAGEFPILGVCLGHQCIAQVFGGRIVEASKCMHGKTSTVSHDGHTIFTKLQQPFCAMRYNSLIVESQGLPDDLEVSARSETDDIMALRHKKLRIEGVQFHPESFATSEGQKLLKNFTENV